MLEIDICKVTTVQTNLSHATRLLRHFPYLSSPLYVQHANFQSESADLAGFSNSQPASLPIQLHIRTE